MGVTVRAHRTGKPWPSCLVKPASRRQLRDRLRDTASPSRTSRRTARSSACSPCLDATC